MDPSLVICRTICPITCAIAPTPTARNSTDQTGEYTKPPSQAPAIVGSAADEPERQEAPGRRPLALARQWRDDRQPFRRVVQREADDQQRAERRLAESERRADRQAFTEIVETDPDRNQQRQYPAAAALCRCAPP